MNIVCLHSQGDTVIDLGSGAGLDVFLARNKIGKSGKAIGVDMNKVFATIRCHHIHSSSRFQDMLAKANRNKDVVGADNVEFVFAPITNIWPLSDESADCIISNCVFNLVPEREKQLVFTEMSRLLRSGGRVAVSDILLKKDLPASVARDIALYVGCVAGASKAESYEAYFKTAGFKSETFP